MVVIGHSQGGLLTRLMVTDSGTRFWDSFSDVPFDKVEMSPEARALMQRSGFFEHLPFVTRVVFVATPHRGSFRVSSFMLGVLRRLVTPPGTGVAGIREVAARNRGLSGVDGIPNAVENMRPGQRFVRTLSASPLAAGVTAHSIIAVRGAGPPSGQNDGVVTYESAHVDGVASEKIVRSEHSVQGKPETILELRRILYEHLGIPCGVECEVPARVDAAMPGAASAVEKPAVGMENHPQRP